MAEPEEPMSVEASDPSLTMYVCAVWNVIIRPPRAGYTRVELMGGFPCGKFRLGGQPVERSNFLLPNARGHKLACTLFEPDVDEEERACVVFCHGNASCRLAAFRLVQVLLPLNIALACFDFSGCGMSGGEYISLGYHERDDLACVVEHLRSKRGFSRIGLWGISMGAATSLMHAARDPTLAGVVADSPFADLWQLIEEVCYNCARVPAFMVSPLLNLMRWVIKGKAGFDIKDVSPLAHVRNCFVPALFLHGKDDDFIAPSNSERLMRAYQGEAQLLGMPDTSHNSRRHESFDARATLFLVRALRWEQHLPQGVAEEQLSSVIARSQRSAPREPLVISAAARADVRRLLESGCPRDRSQGLVRAACELCAAYRGASATPCGPPSAPPFAGPPRARRLTRFAGRVVFAGNEADIGICWAQTGTDGQDRVTIAMLSPTAASLAEVALRRAGPRDGEGSASSPSCAGRVLQAVRSLAFAAPPSGTTLAPGRPHDIALVIAETEVLLSVGGISITSPAGCSGDDLHLWCLTWEQHEGAGGAASPWLELENCATPPRTEAQPHAVASAAAGGRGAGKGPHGAGARLTEGLETLRFGMQETFFPMAEGVVPADMEGTGPPSSAGHRPNLRTSMWEGAWEV